MKLISNIGLAFIDAYGLKNLAFQLCERINGRLEAVAIVDIVQGDVVRFIAVSRLQRKQLAIERLAKIHATTTQYHSIPTIQERMMQQRKRRCRGNAS